MAFIVLSSFVTAQNKIKIEIPESFPAGGSISFQVLLYDSQNNLINDNVDIIIEDAEKTISIEKTISSNKQTNIELGENPRAGIWTITAKYHNTEIKEFFTIATNDIATYNIIDDKLFIKNVGNGRYTKTINIIIGETIGTKEIDLDVGEETNLRLVAPDGNYNIRIIADGKTTLTKENVALTGNVIGVLDEKLVSGGSSITGGPKPGEKEDDSFYSSIKRKKFAYVFLLVIIGSAILLAIERRYRKKYK